MLPFSTGGCSHFRSAFTECKDERAATSEARLDHDDDVVPVVPEALAPTSSLCLETRFDCDDEAERSTYMECPEARATLPDGASEVLPVDPEMLAPASLPPSPITRNTVLTPRGPTRDTHQRNDPVCLARNNSTSVNLPLFRLQVP